MNDSALTPPLVDILEPTDFIPPVEIPPIEELPGGSLAILDPGNLGTVLSVGEVNALPGTTLIVPIAISDAEGLQSLTLDFSFDASLLSIIDPNPNTPENESVRRAGISADFVLEPSNPVANVNQETGEVSLSLINTQGVLEADAEGNVPSGTILEIEFVVDEDAEPGAIAEIDLQSARVGVDDADIVVGNSNLGDGSVTIAENSTIELFRFRNTNFSSGTYVFVGESEREAILDNPDFNQTFSLDGVEPDGTVNPAFTASTTPGDGLIPFFRLASLAVPGTFLFVSTGELNGIFAEGSDQADQWLREGFDAEGNDIPEFYLFDGAADRGEDFNRFQNTQNNTFLFAGPSESDAIANDPNLSSLFTNQGVAFESLV